MKKTKKQNARSTANSKIALTATLLSIPMLATPSMLFAQKTGHHQTTAADTAKRTLSDHQTQIDIEILKFANIFKKNHQTYSIVGLDDGHTIYKNSRGEFFYINPENGDMKYISLMQDIQKFTSTGIKSGKSIRYLKINLKENTKVNILGVDAVGNVLQKNSAGEKFYLDPATGDMIFVK